MKTSLLLLTGLLTFNAYAYPAERARHELQGDFLQCAAYGVIMKATIIRDSNQGNAARKKQEQPIIKAYDSWAEFDLEAGSSLSNSEEAIAAFQLQTKEMMHDIKNDIGNIDILMNRYGYPCKALNQDPIKRLHYWLNKTDK